MAAGLPSDSSQGEKGDDSLAEGEVPAVGLPQALFSSFTRVEPLYERFGEDPVDQQQKPSGGLLRSVYRAREPGVARSMDLGGRSAVDERSGQVERCENLDRRQRPAPMGSSDQRSFVGELSQKDGSVWDRSDESCYRSDLSHVRGEWISSPGEAAVATESAPRIPPHGSILHEQDAEDQERSGDWKLHPDTTSKGKSSGDDKPAGGCGKASGAQAQLDLDAEIHSGFGIQSTLEDDSSPCEEEEFIKNATLDILAPSCVILKD